MIINRLNYCVIFVFVLQVERTILTCFIVQSIVTKLALITFLKVVSEFLKFQQTQTLRNQLGGSNNGVLKKMSQFSLSWFVKFFRKFAFKNFCQFSITNMVSLVDRNLANFFRFFVLRIYFRRGFRLQLEALLIALLVEVIINYELLNIHTKSLVVYHHLFQSEIVETQWVLFATVKMLYHSFL